MSPIKKTNKQTVANLTLHNWFSIQFLNSAGGNTVKKAVDVASDFRAAISATQNWGQNIAFFLAVKMHIIYIL